MTGDIVQHDLDAKELKISPQQKLALLQKLYREVLSIITKHFPDTPLVHAFGNNDQIDNYQTPKESTGMSPEEFFSAFYQTLFTEMPQTTAKLETY
jgi:beta-galactosidase GanA